MPEASSKMDPQKDGGEQGVEEEEEEEEQVTSPRSDGQSCLDS